MCQYPHLQIRKVRFKSVLKKKKERKPCQGHPACEWHSEFKIRLQTP